MKAIIASENGCLYEWDYNNPANLHVITKANDYLMGLSQFKETTYIGSRNHIYLLNSSNLTEVLFNKHSSYHHLSVVDGILYATATRKNEIHCLNLNTSDISKHVVAPPDPLKPIKAKEDGGVNYNHINKIFYHNRLFYINLNWFTHQYGPSGVAVLDKHFKEVNRFQYGWESHGFCIVNNCHICLCANSNLDNNDRKCGLMVDGKLEFIHSSDWFCKGLAINDDFVVLAGGSVTVQKQRQNANGILYILDRGFKHLNTFEFDQSGGFKEVMLLGKDYTKNKQWLD